jgi:hypothetical protein
VGWWTFDEASPWVNDCATRSVLDSSGSANNGASCTAGSGPTSAVPGKIGSARVFSGTNSFVQVPNTASTNVPANQDFSYSVWLKRSGSSTSSFVLSKGAGSEGDTGYSLVMSAGTTPIAELSKPGEASRLLIAGSPLTDTNWHLITATFQRGSQGILYVDGLEQTSVSITSYNVDLTNSKPLVIGAYSSGATGFAGTLDDVRLYRGALTPSDVSQLFAGSLVLVQPFLTSAERVFLGDLAVAAFSLALAMMAFLYLVKLQNVSRLFLRTRSRPKTELQPPLHDRGERWRVRPDVRGSGGGQPAARSQGDRPPARAG